MKTPEEIAAEIRNFATWGELEAAIATAIREEREARERAEADQQAVVAMAQDQAWAAGRTAALREAADHCFNTTFEGMGEPVKWKDIRWAFKRHILALIDNEPVAPATSPFTEVPA